jgi:hypothetical protein
MSLILRCSSGHHSDSAAESYVPRRRSRRYAQVVLARSEGKGAQCSNSTGLTRRTVGRCSLPEARARDALRHLRTRRRALIFTMLLARAPPRLELRRQRGNDV